MIIIQIAINIIISTANHIDSIDINDMATNMLDRMDSKRPPHHDVHNDREHGCRSSSSLRFGLIIVGIGIRIHTIRFIISTTPITNMNITIHTMRVISCLN